MKRITYAGRVFVTTDALAAELVRFAVELANREQAESIDVPGVTLNGQPSVFTIVIGPASQIVVDELTDEFEFDADAAERSLRDQRLRSGNPPSAVLGSDDRHPDAGIEEL